MTGRTPILHADPIPYAGLGAAPWRNGGGVTREVLRLPENASAEASPEEFAARISIADVDASGPFSAYPGIDRIIMLVGGSSMRLTIDGRRAELLPLHPFAFAGDASTLGEIDSPTRDLNVMTCRGLATATMTVVHGGPRQVDVRTGEDAVIVGLPERGCVVALQDGSGGVEAEKPIELGDLDCLHLHGLGSATVRGEGAVITVTRRGTPPGPTLRGGGAGPKLG
mgnify:CR=1 FL=1